MVFLAEEQTAGRGRKGNSWFSPPHQNLYHSIVLRPRNTKALQYIAYMYSLAVQRALQQIGIASDLKWPNDVLVRERKISGILIQTSMEDQRLQFAIVGCGVNVNVPAFPPDLESVATSVAIEKGSEASREALLASILFEFESLYGKIDETEWEIFAEQLEHSSSYLRDCPVRIVQDGGSFEGVTAGLDAFGGLKVISEGQQKIVYAGEVISCRKKQQP